MRATPVTAKGQGLLPGMPEPLYVASPSRLLAWLDCPRRYRMLYLDRPRPAARPQRAHTSVGLSTHHALHGWWDLPPPQRTPAAGGRLVRRRWVEAGFRDAEQSDRWRERVAGEVTSYLEGVDPSRQPLGVERTLGGVFGPLALSGRVDRLDERGGQLVVVDYKTSRRPPTDEDARGSLPLALYAALAWRVLRRRCVRVELHHVPTGTVAGHEHTPESLRRKVAEARSIAVDARAADADYRRHVEARPDTGPSGATDDAAAEALDERFPVRVTPLCRWCDYRAHCPQGQSAGPEQPSWAALDEP